MSNSTLFRGKVFGGFNRKDVLAYIEQLQNKLAALRTDFDALDSQVRVLQRENAQIPELLKQAEEKAELEKVNEELCERIRELEAGQSRADEEYEKVKAAEAQLGAAFVDARRYSDEIVSAARDRAADVSKQASDDIALKAEQIRSVAAEADRITLDMRQKMEALSRSISDLSGKMSSVAVTLIKTEAEPEFRPRVDFDALAALGFENTDDITGVETDEETGMTFISYEPNTRFNEDLDIKPEAAES